MTNPMIYHESALGDIIDFAKQASGNKVTKVNSKMNASSIAKATSNLVLTFPVICSRGIAIENSAMVTKALEKNFVTMIQQLLAANNISDFGNVQDYIDSFHKNIDSTIASFDDILTLMGESVDYATPADKAAIAEAMRYIDVALPDRINETALTDYVVREGAVSGGRQKGSSIHNHITGDNEKVEVNIDVKQPNGGGNKDDLKSPRSASEYFNKQVTDGDYKKANELMPTMLTVSFKVKDNNGSLNEYGNALIGVKAKLYPIGSNDIVSHIVDKTRANANWLVNILKLATREISVSSFLKDFVFAVDKAKMDAASYSTKHPTGASKMWNVLERRATGSKYNRIMRDSNAGAAAITTLCVSQEEVEYIKKTSGIDLESLSVIKGLFESYNLICICIVDETLEVAKFVFDTNDPTWENYPFTHLERESSDNTYKRVVNLISKSH